jgi:hypothetical protein
MVKIQKIQFRLSVPKKEESGKGEGDGRGKDEGQHQITIRFHQNPKQNQSL